MDWPATDIRDSLEWTSKAYAQNLLDEPDFLNYLADRGIYLDPDLPEEVGNPYRLGYVREPRMPAHDHVMGRLSIPYLRPYGGPLSMKFRDLTGEDRVKYIGQAGCGIHLYNTSALYMDSDYVGICEGELDAIVATEAGIPSVGVPGATSWRDEWKYLFDGRPAVLVFADGDTPGRQFAETVASNINNARRVDMPEDGDVSSLVASEGPDALLSIAGAK